jgi:hypothetical protein
MRYSFAKPAGHGDPHHLCGTGLVAELCGELVKATERWTCSSCGIFTRIGDEPEELGRTRCETLDGAIERFPQFRPAPAEADIEKVVDRFDQNFIVGVARVRACLDCIDQQSVRGVDIADSLEEVIRSCHRPSQRTRMLGVALTHRVEQLRRVAKVTQKVGADVSGLRHPAAPVDSSRAHIGRPQQTVDRGDRVTSPQDPARGFLKKRRHVFVRSNRRLSEVPNTTFGSDMRRKSSVGFAALTARGQFGHRRSRQRMSERQSPIKIDTDQPRPLGGHEPLQFRLPGGGAQDAEIACAIENGQQQ